MLVKKQNSGEVILAGDANGGEIVLMQDCHFLVIQHQDDNGNACLVDIEDGYLEYVSPETELTIVKHILVINPTEATKNYLSLDQFDKKQVWTSKDSLLSNLLPDPELVTAPEKATAPEPEKSNEVLSVKIPSLGKKKKKKKKNLQGI
jgi:hypothetical protein